MPPPARACRTHAGVARKATLSFPAPRGRASLSSRWDDGGPRGPRTWLRPSCHILSRLLVPPNQPPSMGRLWDGLPRIRDGAWRTGLPCAEVSFCWALPAPPRPQDWGIRESAPGLGARFHRRSQPGTWHWVGGAATGAEARVRFWNTWPQDCGGSPKSGIGCRTLGSPSP